MVCQLEMMKISMNMALLICNDEGIQPQQTKQLVPYGPPTYEKSLQDNLEGKKKIYVDPEYFPKEAPPDYEEEEGIDYSLLLIDEKNMLLDDKGVKNYVDVEKQLSEPEMTTTKTKSYLNKILNAAKSVRQQLKGYKSQVSGAFNRNEINEAEKIWNILEQIRQEEY